MVKSIITIYGNIKSFVLELSEKLKQTRMHGRSRTYRHNLYCLWLNINLSSPFILREMVYFDYPIYILYIYMYMYYTTERKNVSSIFTNSSMFWRCNEKYVFYRTVSPQKGKKKKKKNHIWTFARKICWLYPP